MVENLLRRALGDDFAAVASGARSHVDDMIGLKDRLLVMLDHQDGVPQVPQALQGLQQATVVALMQADRRFIEDIEDPDQRGPDLCRQADALAFTAGEGSGCPLKGQVVKTDIDQERQALANLLENPPGDFRFLGRQLQPGKEGAGIAHAQGADLLDIPPGDLDAEGFRFQARPLARRAGHDVHVLFELLAGRLGIGLPQAALEVRHHPFKRLVIIVPAVSLVVEEADWLLAGTVEQHLPDAFRQLGEGRADVEFIEIGQGLENLLIVEAGARCPGQDRPFAQGEPVVGDHLFGIEVHAGAEPGAVGTGAVGVVEGEHARRHLRDGDAAVDAGQGLGEELAVATDGFDPHQPFAEAQRGFQGVGQATGDAVFDNHAVDDHFDGVLFVLVERDLVAKLVHRAIDAHPHETIGLQLTKFLAIFALAPAHQRRQQQQAAAFRQFENPLNYLLDALRGDLLTAGGAVHPADPGKQQAQVVVDFGDRADRRARVLRRGLLFDGDRRGEAFDALHVRLVHLFEKLSGIGREAFHVAPLPLGIDGIEGERALAGPGNAGDHHQLVAWDLDVDALEIVLAGTLDDDLVSHGNNQL